jgi:hypothetical protein
MSKITPQEKLDLKKLLKESDAQDNTDYIRRVKHSVKIRDDIRALDKLKKSEALLYQTDPARFTEVAQRIAPFLHENYADLFKKMVAEELDLAIMSRLLAVLKLIEDGKTDQHEGSVMVGKILKELYVDSTLKKCKKMDEAQDADEKEPEPKVEGKPISWGQWRSMRTKIVADLTAAGVLTPPLNR